LNINLLSSKYEDIRIVGLSMGGILAKKTLEINKNNSHITKTYLINPAFYSGLSETDNFLCKFSPNILEKIFKFKFAPNLTTETKSLYDNSFISLRNLPIKSLRTASAFCGASRNITDDFKDLPVKIIVSKFDEKLSYEYLKNRNIDIVYLNSFFHVVSLDETVLKELVSALDIPI